MTAILRVATMFAAGFLLTSAAVAGETITYKYDELGRLIELQSTGTVNNNQTVSTAFDAAGNRTNYSVTGSPNGSGGSGSGGASVGQRLYVVVPLNGYSLIVIDR